MSDYRISLDIPDEAQPIEYRFSDSDLPLTMGSSDARAHIVVKHDSIEAEHVVLEAHTEPFHLVARWLAPDDSGKTVKQLTMANGSIIFLGEVRAGLKTSDEAGSDDEERDHSGRVRWFYRTANNDWQGPITSSDLRKLAADGAITRDTPVRYGNETALASDVEGLEFTDASSRPTQVQPQSLLTHDGVGDCVCPNCWWAFERRDLVYISEHPALTDDLVLGEGHQQRFLPTRFTPDGLAIDPKGHVVTRTACPRCHLPVPQSCAYGQQLILSIAGAPSSGKSYLLATMSRSMREQGPTFAVLCNELDAERNDTLAGYERMLFESDPDKPVALQKTDIDGEAWYNRVGLDGIQMLLPKPMFFDLALQPMHPQVADKNQRTLVMYDNAGESFEPGRDTSAQPATRHLTKAHAILFLFDPTRNASFTAACDGGDDPQVSDSKVIHSQHRLLGGLINRIRQQSAMKPGDRYSRPFLVIVPKYDIWRHLMPYQPPDLPWESDHGPPPQALDINLIYSVSFAVRSLLETHCREIVDIAENFARHVLYIPVSALGSKTVKLPQTDESARPVFAVHPRDIAPWWTSVPLLYLLYDLGLIRASTDPAFDKTERLSATGHGDTFHVQTAPDCGWTLPSNYLGRVLRCPRTGKMFIPTAEHTNGDSDHAEESDLDSLIADI